MAGTLTIEMADINRARREQFVGSCIPDECRGCAVTIKSSYDIRYNADIFEFTHNSVRLMFVANDTTTYLERDGFMDWDTRWQKIRQWFLGAHREMFSRHAAIRYVALESEVL